MDVYTLKIRGGSDTYIKKDGSIGTAGKGALIQTNLSATLGVTQDQVLFVPMRERQKDGRIHNGNGSSQC